MSSNSVAKIAANQINLDTPLDLNVKALLLTASLLNTETNQKRNQQIRFRFSSSFCAPEQNFPPTFSLSSLASKRDLFLQQRLVGSRVFISGKAYAFGLLYESTCEGLVRHSFYQNVLLGSIW